MLGIEGYEPQWCHSGKTLAAIHRPRFSRLIGRTLERAWLMWDLEGGRWFADGPVILGFGDVHVEVTHRKFDECGITWGQVDISLPLAWPGLTLGWRPDAHPALLAARGRRLREVNVIERIMPSHWRPRVLHAVEFLFDGPRPAVEGSRVVMEGPRPVPEGLRPAVEGSRLAIFNALDENGITDETEVDLPVGFWCRVPVA